ncbi:MAG: cobalt-precorrin 5A hydrolase [Methanomassiliicoccaceae archaeon]|jgi:cobalt-precorrin 5A hydrolase|nr:cobalt-precorrin 5A hydrolase [Methanomassiliicoccaceae archaeon]
MRMNIIGFSSRGCALAKKITEELTEHDCRCFGRTIGDEHGTEHVGSVDEWTATSFRECDAVIFIGAAGIAVRHIAPYLKSKTEDPAVIVIDELGRNIVPILSGHIGGANRLSALIGERIGGNVIITTATDLNNVFAVDTFAAENNMHISNPSLIKNISARLLEGKPVCIMSDVRIEGSIPEGLTYAHDGDAGIYITPFTHPSPFTKTLRLVPKHMNIGIGCRRGTDMETIERCVTSVLKENSISVHSLKAGGSIDIKSNEKGLLAFFGKHDIPVRFFSRRELEEIRGEFTESKYVESVVGIGNVCERSAMALSEDARLIVKKTAIDGVTVAIASEHNVIRFGGVR